MARFPMHVQFGRAIAACLICSPIYFLVQPCGIYLNLLRQQTIYKFDPLAATASPLQEQLSAGKLTSVELCRRFFDQIAEHDHYLKAVLARAPTALS